MKNLQELEERIGYRFQDRQLLRHALTHSSYANEKKLGRAGSNERLEFLGDAVLELVTSEFLFHQYEELAEGELTRRRAGCVCEPALSGCAKEFGFQEFLLLGKGEEMTGGRGRDSIISDGLEALIGAIYLDGGLASAKEFILRTVLNDVEHKQLFYDSKTILQEMVQEKGSNPVEYRLLSETGPDHNKVFAVEVCLGEKRLGKGSGHTKKAAEQAAAYEAVRVLKSGGR